MTRITLANCDIHQLEEIRRLGLHPTRERSAMIFAAGALDNRRLSKDLGSMELSTFYDGQLAAGHIESNPYWPRHVRPKPEATFPVGGNAVGHAADAASGERRDRAPLRSQEIAMLMRGRDGEYLPARHYVGSGHGQAFVHFFRRHPELFERRYDVSTSTYRLSELGRAERDAAESDRTRAR